MTDEDGSKRRRRTRAKPETSEVEDRGVGFVTMTFDHSKGVVSLGYQNLDGPHLLVMGNMLAEQGAALLKRREVEAIRVSVRKELEVELRRNESES